MNTEVFLFHGQYTDSLSKKEGSRFLAPFNLFLFY